MAAQDLPDEIEVEELKSWIEQGKNFALIDVREPVEKQIAEIPGARLVPLRELVNRLDDIPDDQDCVLHCHHGARSAQACYFLKQRGYRRVINLAGGIDAWSVRIDPSVARY